MSTGQRAVIVFFDWEGNRSSGVVTVSVAQRWMDNPIQPNPTRQMLDNPAHKQGNTVNWRVKSFRWTSVGLIAVSPQEQIDVVEMSQVRRMRLRLDKWLCYGRGTARRACQ